MDLSHLTLTEISEGLAKGTFSSLEVTNACLAVAAKQQPRTNAWTQLLIDQARAEAEASDQRRATGSSRGPLDGVPVAVKDNMLAVGSRSTAASPRSSAATSSASSPPARTGSP